MHSSRLGRLEAARQTYLRVPAILGATDEIKVLAREKSESLRALSDNGVVRFSALTAGSVVQLDDEMVTDLGSDVAITADRHLICVLPPQSERLDCQVRRFTAGTRVDWPGPNVASSRGVIVIPRTPEVAALKLDGVLLRGDFRTIRAIDLDPGTYPITVRLRDGSEWVRDVDLVSGSPLTLSTLAPAPEPAADPTAGVVQDGPTPQPWSWVVIGTGAAATAAGVGLLVNAHLLQNPDDETSQADAEQQWEEARPYVAAGWSLVGTGAAALIGGIVWNVLSESDASVTATVSPSESGAFFMVHGHW